MYEMLSHMADTSQHLLVVRDGLLFGILWQTCYRGSNAGGVRLDNILLPTGDSALAYLVPNKLPIGAMLHLLPDTTKNKKGGHCIVTLTCDVLCMSTWLQLVVHYYVAAGQPITNFITRPLQVGTKLFTEMGMTCSAAWARLTKHLKAENMYPGQSVHSTKGGSMMHRQQQLQHVIVQSDTQTAEAAMCNEKNVKYFADPHRPTRGHAK